MSRTVLLEWEGQEYDHNPKTNDWYWALGIIAVAGTIAAILFGSYLIAILIVIASGVVALHAGNHPPTHRFKIIDHGLIIGEELHPFEYMSSFSVLEDIEGEFPPQLSVKTTNWLSPHLIIPLEGVDADMVYAYFLQNVKEEKHHHSFHDLVAALLRF